MNFWLFQGNPTRWRMDEYLRDNPDEDFTNWDWSVARYVDHIEVGDGAALWMAGPIATRGVHAVGRIIGTPERRASESEYWTDPADGRRLRWCARMTFEHVLLDDPILATDLRRDPRFAEASILRVPRGGNPHRLSRREWDAILERLPD